jgi:predicted MFS family arabinose efflux permease
MKKNELPPRQTWSAVGSMALCVSMLVAAEFMPVSLLTPLARDLRTTERMAGQATSISGLFAVVASLLIATVAGQYNRRHVLLGFTGVMLASLILIASHKFPGADDCTCSSGRSVKLSWRAPPCVAQSFRI